METTKVFDPERERQKRFAQAFKVKSYDLNHVKDVDTTKRTVIGISNMFNFFDKDYDVLLPGSTKRSITERGPNTNVPGKIKHTLFHDLTQLPSKVQVLEERKENERAFQYFEAKMLNTTDGNDTLIKYQEGVYDQHSIGFQYLDIEYIDEDSANWKKSIDKLINPKDAEGAGFMFLVKEIRQFEFSTVAFGANELTPYLGVKSDNKELRIIKLQERIDRAIKLAKNGRLSDDGHESLEIELLQLKQLLAEAINEEPSLKDTLLKEQAHRKKDTSEKFDIAKAIQETNFFK